MDLMRQASVTAPVFATLCKPIEYWRQFLYKFEMGLSFMYLSATIAVMSVARRPPEIYNPVYVAYLFYLFVLVVVLVALVVVKIIQLQHLLQEIDSTRQTSNGGVKDFSRVIQRLDSMLVVVLGFFFVCTPGYILSSSFMLAVGSFPMNYVFITMISCSAWPLTPWLLKFLGRRRSKGGVPSTALKAAIE
jgi:hypothetical protein